MVKTAQKHSTILSVIFRCTYTYPATLGSDISTYHLIKHRGSYKIQYVGVLLSWCESWLSMLLMGTAEGSVIEGLEHL